MMRKSVWFLLLLVQMACVSTGWAQVRLSPSGQPPPNGDGSSWATPLPAGDLQKIIDSGASEIWLARGIYPTVHLRRGTVIKGGFVADPNAPKDTARDPDNYKSYLPGVRATYYWRLADGTFFDLIEYKPYPDAVFQLPGSGDQVDGCTLSSDPFFSTSVYIGGTDGRIVFTNCHFVGTGLGYGNVKAGAYIRAAGVDSEQIGAPQTILPSKARFDNCDFQQCAWGGIIARGGSDIEVVNCHFFDNNIGLWADLTAEPLEPPVVFLGDSRFDHNGLVADFRGYFNSLHFGGAKFGGSDVRIERCVFTQNLGYGVQDAGGLSIDLNQGGRGTVKDCTITQNMGQAGAGGGMTLWTQAPSTFDPGPVPTAPDTLLVSHCTVTDNVSSFDPTTYASAETGNGGGIYVRGGGMTLDACLIARNQASGTGGGVAFLQSPLYQGFGSPTPVFRNCVIAANTAATGGGGIYLFHANPRLENDTIASNSAPKGGAIYAYGIADIDSFSYPVPDSTPDNVAQFVNCALFGNTATASASSALWFDQGTRHVISSGRVVERQEAPPAFLRCAYEPSATWYRNSIFYSPAPGPLPAPTADGSFATTNPGFVNATALDFHLTAASPLINTGDNALVSFGNNADFDNLARILGPNVDIGAFERTLPPANVVFTAAAGTNGNPIEIDARLGNIGGLPAQNCIVTGVTAVDALGKAYMVQNFQYSLNAPGGALPADNGATTARLKVTLAPNGNNTGFVRLMVTGSFVGGKFSLNRYITLK